MGRIGDTTTGTQSRGPQPVLRLTAFGSANAWWLFCVLVLAIKLLLFWLDPTPKIFMGDSGAYIQTAR